MTVSNRLALVTGASRGIGAAIALELARSGARVIVNHLNNRSQADGVLRKIRDEGGEAWAESFDVSQRPAVRKSLEHIRQNYGTVDILINNAGILRDKTFQKMEDSEWDDVIAVNLTGVANVCSAVIPGMLSQRFGRIVNISSFVAQAGNFGQANYAASKAGIIGFSRSLALEVAHKNVTVNCICPGFIATDMWREIPEDVRTRLISRIPMRRTGTPEEIAQLARFLVNEADYITGQALNINGGIFIG